jgi:hypothetical protein
LRWKRFHSVGMKPPLARWRETGYLAETWSWKEQPNANGWLALGWLNGGLKSLHPQLHVVERPLQDDWHETSCE